MNRKKIYLPLLLVTAIMMVGLVNAASTFVTPGASATLRTTTQVINVSCGLANAVNASVTASSTLSGDTMSAITLTNLSIDGTYVNYTLDTTALEDAADWVFAGTCYNSSGDSEAITSRTGVTVDNTVPAISSCTIGGSSAASGEVGSSSPVFTCTVSYATACTVYWKGDDTTDGSSDTDADCTDFTGSSTSATCTISQVEDSANNLLYSCTDGTNITNSSTYAISLSGFSTSQDAARKTTTTVTDDNVGAKKALIVVLASAFVVVLIGVVLATSKKK